MKKLTLLFMLLYGMGTEVVLAQLPSVGVDVNISESAVNNTLLPIEPATEVSMEVNPLNPKHLVAMANSDSFLYYSLDGGMSWQNISMDDVGVFNAPGIFHTDPSLTFDDRGNLYAATGSFQPTSQMAICRFNNGEFDTYPVHPAYCTTFAANDKWHIGAGPAPGNPAEQYVYAAFVGSGSAIKVSYSTDGGVTFMSSTASLGTGTFPRPVVDANGDVYVAWQGGDGISVARSTDGGLTFGSAVLAVSTPLIFKTTVPAQPERGIFTGPVIDVDRSGGPYNGSIYITYVDQGTHGGNDYDIFVVRSDDGGVHWTDPKRINNDTGAATQFLPWLDVDQKTGTVSVAWYDTREDSSNVKVKMHISTSIDGGRTFGPNIPVADEESDESNDVDYVTSAYDYAEYIGVAVDGCVAHAVWSDNHTTHASASGWFRKNPPVNSTLTLNGAAWTFVSGVAVGNQTQIGANKSETVASLVNDLNASLDLRILEAHYTSNSSDVLTIQASDAGISGGDFTLAVNAPDGCDSMTPPNGPMPPGGWLANVCYVNFVDNNVERLITSLNLKTDQVPVPCTPGDQTLVISKNAPVGFAGSILRHDGVSGVFIDEFIPNCSSADPFGGCDTVPGAAENPVDLIFGPDQKLYVADSPIGSFGFTPTGIAVKRYNGTTGEYNHFSDPDPYADFIHYGEGGLEGIGGLTFGPDSNLYVSDYLRGGILRYHGQTGAIIDTYVPLQTMQSPRGTLFGPDGNLYVVDSNLNEILRFQGPFNSSPGANMGSFVTAGGGGMEQMFSSVFSPSGQLYVSVSNLTGFAVQRYQGPFDSVPGQLVNAIDLPAGISLSCSEGAMSFGPDGYLHISHCGSSNGILRLDTNINSVIGRTASVHAPGRFVFSSVPEVRELPGDFNHDGCIDRVGDMMIIMNAIRSGSTDNIYDLNEDGSINIADARKLVLLFTEPMGAACP